MRKHVQQLCLATLFVLIPFAASAQSADDDDAVTQANTKILGEAPAVSMGNLEQAAGQTLNPLEQAPNAEDAGPSDSPASTTEGVTDIFEADTDASPEN